MEDLRKYLPRLQTSDRLDTPQIRQLLSMHGRLPLALTPAAIGDAAAKLLRDKIAALERPTGSTWAQRLPHRVLETCFIRQLKNFQAAQELGISERQLSRERTRALRLLASELSPPPVSSVPLDPIPSIDGHLQRETLVRRLAHAVATERIVAVGGERGSGKTSTVAALARLVQSDQVWWIRLRPGLNDCLESFLLELGQALAREGYPALINYLSGALPRPNLATASRLSLDSISRVPRLIVLDDFVATHEQEAIRTFLDEAVTRIPNLSVITVGATRAGKATLEIPPLSKEETGQLMRAHGVVCDEMDLQAIHGLTAGQPGLVAATGLWWSGDAEGRKSFEQQVAQRGPVGGLVSVVSLLHRRAA